MNYLSLVVILSFSAIISLNAQKGDITNGYIIKNDSVEVEGYVQLQKDFDYVTRVKFSEKENFKKYPIFKTKSILGYGFETTRYTNLNEPYIYWRHFKIYELDRPARMFASNTSFIEKILEGGEYEVWQFLYETGADIEMPITTRYIIFQDGEEICQIEARNFIESASTLFEGYTSLVKSLGKKQFRFDNFIRLVEDFNFWIENGHDPKIYKMNPKIFAQ